MILHEAIAPRWKGYKAAIVAATGPSLTQDVADLCESATRHALIGTIAVNDAHRLMPWAEVLYSCDAAWWQHHKGVQHFQGERWSSHGSYEGSHKSEHAEVTNNKKPAALEFGLHLVRGKSEFGFSFDPGFIHFGSNSGFQAINLALLFGVKRVILVGFNMQVPAGAPRHFFGNHPKPLLNNTTYLEWVPHYRDAARRLPPGIEIINATPNTALTCFPQMELSDALELQREMA